VRSVAGAAYDLFGYVKASFVIPLNGLKFTTPTMDYDTWISNNCARYYGGGFWYNKCGVFSPTTIIPPEWYSPPDDHWYVIKNVRMMVKLQ